MADILVAGAGHGGLTAAIKLAEAGHNVTVFEKNKKNECGLDQTDFFDRESFVFADFDIPPEFETPNNQVTFLPLEEDAPGITMPIEKNYRSLAANRRELYKYFFRMCDDAGVSLVFGTEILKPIVLGNRVCGIRTDKGDFFGDLIIDACGVNSPVRSNLPIKLGIEKSYGDYNVLHAYRAYYKKLNGVQGPETPYNLYLCDDGTVGLSWLVTDDDKVDVLIARFSRNNFTDITSTMNMLKRRNPQLSDEMLCCSGFVDIPVRQSPAIFVADGYAAVGDSAFMTFPVKGSGIAFSVYAGTLLAETVISDKSESYSIEKLWEYERAYFHKCGFQGCIVAIARNVLPYLTARELNDLFKRELLTTEDLSDVYENTFQTIFSLKTFIRLKDKMKVLSDFPEFRVKMHNMLSWFRKYAPIQASFPEKYDKEDIAKWAAKYDEFFDEIKYKG